MQAEREVSRARSFAARGPTPPPRPPLLPIRHRKVQFKTGEGPVLKWSESTKSWHWRREEDEHGEDGEHGEALQDADNRATKASRGHKQGLIWELMPMLWTLRTMLMLPVSIGENGSISFSWRSAPVALTFLVWLVMATVGYFSIRFYLDPITGDKHFHVWDLVPQYCNAFSMCYIFLMPYTSWGTASEALTMLEQWQRVEGLVTVLRGSMPVPGLRRRVWCYAFLSFVFPVTMCLVTLGLYSYDEAWMAPILIHLFGYSMLATCFWNLSCRGLASVAVLQAAHLVGDFQRLGIPAIRTHRKAWLGMARVLDLLSICWGRTHAVLLLLSFVSFVSIIFLLLCVMRATEFDNRFIWLAAVMLYCFGIITSVCNSAHIATDALRRPTTKQLLLLSLAQREKATSTEIWLFLRDISLSPPKVTMTGLAILSRATIISFFTLANTYICVVSQFAISVENTKANFSEDPFQLMLDDE